MRITPKDAQGLLDAYAKVHAPKEEEKTEAPEVQDKVDNVEDK